MIVGACLVIIIYFSDTNLRIYGPRIDFSKALPFTYLCFPLVWAHPFFAVYNARLIQVLSSATRKPMICSLISCSLNSTIRMTADISFYGLKSGVQSNIMEKSCSVLISDRLFSSTVPLKKKKKNTTDTLCHVMLSKQVKGIGLRMLNKLDLNLSVVSPFLRCNSNSFQTNACVQESSHGVLRQMVHFSSHLHPFWSNYNPLQKKKMQQKQKNALLLIE